jgi:hypothetical protein
MKRKYPIIAAVAVATVLLLALSWYLHSWGGPALLAVAAGGYGWYRTQVARGQSGEQFFNDLGEETRLTGFQGGSPSEMPVDRPGPATHEPP